MYYDSDYDQPTPMPEPGSPEMDELIAEFTAHFSQDPQTPCIAMCGYCYEEWELRHRDQEDINLEEDHNRRQWEAYSRDEQDEMEL